MEAEIPTAELERHCLKFSATEKTCRRIFGAEKKLNSFEFIFFCIKFLEFIHSRTFLKKNTNKTLSRKLLCAADLLPAGEFFGFWQYRLLFHVGASTLWSSHLLFVSSLL
jgi:hypothetical protein